MNDLLRTDPTCIEHAVLKTTVETLRAMADDGVFSGKEIRGRVRIRKESVVGRYGPHNKPRDDSPPSGERGFSLPGIVVTYIQHSRPSTSGEQDVDYGTMVLLVQIVSDVEDANTPNVSLYLGWGAQIIRYLQANPYRAISDQHGDVYYVHVEDGRGADVPSWMGDTQARFTLTVRMDTAVPRSKESPSWQSLLGSV